MTRTLTTGAVLATAAVALLIFLYPALAKSGRTEAVEVQSDPLSHEQRAWIGALNWCESRGVDAAVNKVDRDGTPSYGRFQFKPGTFAAYAKQYDIATTTKGVMDGDVQQQILEHMVLDASITPAEWSKSLFPDCIQRHIGLPPK